MWLTSAQGLSSFISLILHLAVRTCHVVAHCKSILTVSYTGFLLIHCVSTLIHKVSRKREKESCIGSVEGADIIAKQATYFHSVFYTIIMQEDSCNLKLSSRRVWKTLGFLSIPSPPPPPLFLCATGTMRIHTSLGNCWGRLSACRIASSAIMLVMIID